MSTRRQVVVLGLIAATLVASLALLGWRFAGDDESAHRVTLSVDGVRWTSDHEAAFFHSANAWLPAQTRSAVFWVRNDGDVTADVDVVVATSAGETLTQSGQVTLSATIGDPGAVHPFVPERGVNTVRIGTLEPGEREVVTLRAEHTGEAELDSSTLRHRISTVGTSAEEPDASQDVFDAQLELAPVFLCVALVVTLIVMRRSGRTRTKSTRRS